MNVARESTPDDFVHVVGPLWVAICHQCEEQKTFEREAEAMAWQHSCEPAEDDEYIVVLTLASDLSRPPQVDFSRGLPTSILSEIVSITRDLAVGGANWQTFIRESHERRRQYEGDQLVKVMERELSHPHHCPGCTDQFGTVRGLKQHMRTCYKIDPAKLRAGEYDDQIGAS